MSERLADSVYYLAAGLLAAYALYRLFVWFYGAGYEDGKMVGRLQGLKVGSLSGAPKSSEHYAD